MKWLQFLTVHRIPYYIYKLKQNDCLILKGANYRNSQVIIILYGITYIMKTFTNKEILPIGILRKNDFLTNKNTNKKTFYKIIGITTSYVIICEESKFNRNIKNTRKKLNIPQNYANTIETYQYMNEIMIQKKTKMRIIQLFLCICIQFGQIKQKEIIIPFRMSQSNIALITGLSKNTVNKAMYIIKKFSIVEHNKTTINLVKILDIKLEQNKKI